MNKHLAEIQHDRPDTHGKALRINLDKRRYGTFAEIGAGQEVVRWFFRVGAAAGSFAKPMTAYEMTVSDGRRTARYQRALFPLSDDGVSVNMLLSVTWWTSALDPLWSDYLAQP